MYELLTQLLTHARGMWRYRWYGLLIAWVVCLIGWPTVYALPAEYQANARVYVDTQSILKPLLKGLAVDTEVSTRVSVMTQTLLSRPNIEKVARETDLGLRAGTPAEMDGLVAHLQRAMTIASSRHQDDLYTITFTDKDPLLAQRVVQALLNVLVEGTLGSSRSDAAGAQRFIDTQIERYEARLIKAEERLANFKKKHVGQMPSEGQGYYGRLQATVDQLEQISGALKVAENRRFELQKQLVAEAAAPVFSETATEIQQRQTELDTLLLRYTDSHPDVIALQQTIQQLEKRREAEESRATKDRALELNPVYQAVKIALGEANVELAALRSQAAAQQKKLDQLKQMVDTIPEVEAELARLDRDYAVTKANYDQLAQRRESAQLSEQVEKSSNDVELRIIDPPIVPQRPAGPNRPLYSTMVLFAGLAAASALAFLLHEIRPVFLSSKILREVTGLPVLGVVCMKWTRKQLLKLRVELASFVIVTLLLMASYGGVILLEDTGVRITQFLMRMV